MFIYEIIILYTFSYIWNEIALKKHDESFCLSGSLTCSKECLEELLHESLPFIELKHPLIPHNSKKVKLT